MTGVIMLAGFLFVIFVITEVSAQTVDEIRDRIDNQSSRISALEREIKQYERQLNEVANERKSLENTLEELNISYRKTEAQIEVTREKITSAEQEIARLENRIENTEGSIGNHKNAMSDAVRRLHEADNTSMVESMLLYNNMSDFWNAIAQLESFQLAIKENVETLRSLKEQLSANRDKMSEEKAKLEALEAELADRKTILEQNREEERELLEKTEEKESEYENILAEKRAKRDQFLSELQTLEAELKLKIDPNKLPNAGTAVLNWPLRDATGISCYDDGGLDYAACITQYFGHTSFSNRNSGVYNGNGHNGADFRASRGTPVYAAASGVVKGTGNTDAVPGCYSYGKWVLIEHPMGLSTNYAHLSLIKAAKGQNVKQGDLIGYSGNTGYSTGPHLHFSVYATQGVKIVKLGDVREITNCGAASIPVASTEAYLDPLSYLPVRSN